MLAKLRSIISLLMIAVFASVVIISVGAPAALKVSAAPELVNGVINASCYQAAPTTCKIRVDPFQIQISGGEALEAFWLEANGITVYDFSTDLSNPPTGVFAPSQVKQDFAAVCGQEYVVSLLVDDTSQTDFLNIGQTDKFTCPQGGDGPPRNTGSNNYLPLVSR